MTEIPEITEPAFNTETRRHGERIVFWIDPDDFSVSSCLRVVVVVVVVVVP
jgi:hypothetical protein